MNRYVECLPLEHGCCAVLTCHSLLRSSGVTAHWKSAPAPASLLLLLLSSRTMSPTAAACSATPACEPWNSKNSVGATLKEVWLYWLTAAGQSDNRHNRVTIRSAEELEKQRGATLKEV